MQLPRFLVLSVWLASLSCGALAQVAPVQAALVRGFDASDARQGIAVDADHAYLIDNTRIARHDKADGSLVSRLNANGAAGPALIHLDGGVIVAGKLYAAHSNYPRVPMRSSVEIFDAATLRHLDSRPLADAPGSLTWIDRHDGSWWAGFGNYDLVPAGQHEPYGGTDATVLARLDDAFRVVQLWHFPAALLARFRPMSNSGGSWGPDGLLYLTGHDNPELYVVRVPAQGGAVSWLATIAMPGLAGQGIAWDRTVPTRLLWGINRAARRALLFRIPATTGSPPP